MCDSWIQWKKNSPCKKKNTVLNKRRECSIYNRDLSRNRRKQNKTMGLRVQLRYSVTHIARDPITYVCDISYLAPWSTNACPRQSNGAEAHPTKGIFPNMCLLYSSLTVYHEYWTWLCSCSINYNKDPMKLCIVNKLVFYHIKSEVVTS